MKKFIYAVIFTCIGSILLGFNTIQHNPPVTELPIVSNVQPVQATIEPATLPEPKTVEQVIVEQVQQPLVSNQNGRCGDNQLAYDIYMQESSCILDRVNSIGACGLGQALPCSKLSNVCPDWRTNYDCQNQFFTTYAMSYGSWEQAHAFKYCLWTCYSTRTKTIVNKNGEPWW